MYRTEIVPSASQNKMMNTVAEFNKFVASIEQAEGYLKPLAFGLGLRKSKGDKTMEVFFPKINYNSAYGSAAVFFDSFGFSGSSNGHVSCSQAQLQSALDKFKAFENDGKDHPNITLLSSLVKHHSNPQNYFDLDVICYFLYNKDQPVQNPEEGYFKTQCLSQLLVKPHGMNFDGIFGKMLNIAWTNKGPILPEHLTEEKIKWSFKGDELVVSHVDKFPYMVNFHVPDGVRIVMGSKVRLGAHLSPGTTVMPAGFINFNAGTLGKAMVEGRISAGVVIGDKTDIGGGASIMGTLSGGNKHVIVIGEQCLLGANAGTGISLGDGCTVAAGTYITAAAKVFLYNKEKKPVDLTGAVVTEGDNIVKGADLSGKQYLLIYQDSESGRLIARPNTKVIELNESLHV